MMKFPSNWVVTAALTIMMGFFSAPRIVASTLAVDPLHELQKGFPNSIRVNADGEKSIEFCPDNTCHYFVAGKRISLETMKDFAYLYIFFFSDYYALDEWRNRKESIEVAKKILSKSNYCNCKNDEESAARCILRKLSQNNQIKLYFVRYDEGKRNLVPEDIISTTAKSPFKIK
jgi:hypothetical protein